MTMIKSLLAAIPFILAVQQEAAAFSGISLSPERVQLRASTRTTSSIHALTYHKGTSRSVGPLMLSAAQDGEDAISDGDGKIEGRKKRVIVGYKAMMITYLTVGLLSVVKAGVTPFLLCMIAGQVAMPAGISYIMISAAKHDRLSSDTYKRLNLALLEFGLIGVSISAIGGRKQDALLTLSFVLTVINSIKGYTYGVLGWDKQTETTLPKDLLKDLIKGTKDTVKGFITVPKNFKSFTYMAATAMVASLKLLKLNEIVKFVQANSITAGLAPLLHRFNRLAFFTLMLYTVKDAADRDRLGGTTFIQLNYLCALSMGASLYFDTGGIATPMGALSAVFSAFFAFTGITSYMKNQYA